MPLSEQEQRLLDEMERSLYHHDADDVATVGRRGRASYAAITLAIISGVIGLGLLIVGVAARQPIVGLLGFAAMFTGAMFAFAPPARFTVPRASAPRRPGFFDSFTEPRGPEA